MSATATHSTGERVRRDVYAEVTDRILAELERGVVPWHQPWSSLGGPRNLNSGRPYRGINVWLLELMGYSDPRWATFKGVQRAGGNVRKGEKGTHVVLWKTCDVKDADAPDGKRSVPFLRYYVVFNAEQCDGLPELERVEADDVEPVKRADGIVASYIGNGGPALAHGGDRAFYSSADDAVTMPESYAFESTESYYSVLFHELTHSTGHESRLKRLERAAFGSDPYAREELVAELGASMLCGMAGIAPQVEASASYIANWLRSLADDRKLVVVAAAQAQRAVDLMLGTTFGDDWGA